MARLAHSLPPKLAIKSGGFGRRGGGGAQRNTIQLSDFITEVWFQINQ
jgi:hypothetical protein